MHITHILKKGKIMKTIFRLLSTILIFTIYINAFDNNITNEEYKDIMLEKKEKLTLDEDYVINDTQQDISSSNPSKIEPTDPSNEFTIMYLYTTAAKNSVGGESKIRANFQVIINRLNQSFVNSHMNLRARIAHIQEISYPLDTNKWEGDKIMRKKFYDAVTHLEGKHDGYMDNIHALRDRYKADFVQLFIANPAFGGLANVMTTPSRNFESHAFSVVTARNKRGLAAVHELGHNMGICHTDCTGAYPYAHGYSIGNIGTIHGKYTINYWSSPTLQYHGVTIGDSQHDARRAILNTAPYFCNFRTESTHSTIETIHFNHDKKGTWNTSERSTHRKGRYAKYYKFTLTRSTKVTIDLKSSTDAYMFLLSGASSTGSIIQKDDDGGGNHNSRITKTLNRGTYTIEATTYDAGKTGSFTVRVNTSSKPHPSKKAEITYPHNMSTISKQATFRWTKGINVKKIWLVLWDKNRQVAIFSKEVTGTSKIFYNLPVGHNISVNLYSIINGKWQQNHNTYYVR